MWSPPDDSPCHNHRVADPLDVDSVPATMSAGNSPPFDKATPENGQVGESIWGCAPMDEQRNEPKDLVSQISNRDWPQANRNSHLLTIGADAPTTITGGVTPLAVSALAGITQEVSGNDEIGQLMC